MEHLLLSIMVLTPFLGALILAVIPSEREVHIKVVSSFFSLSLLLLAIYTFLLFDRSMDTNFLQYSEKFRLFGKIDYFVALNGLNVFFILLAGIVNFCINCMALSGFFTEKRQYVLFFTAFGSVMGIFCSQNILLLLLSFSLLSLSVYLLYGREKEMRFLRNFIVLLPAVLAATALILARLWIKVPPVIGSGSVIPSIIHAGQMELIHQMIVYLLLLASVFLAGGIWPFQRITARLLRGCNAEMLIFSTVAMTQVMCYILLSFTYPYLSQAMGLCSPYLVIFCCLSAAVMCFGLFIGKSSYTVFTLWSRITTAVTVALIGLQNPSASEGAMLMCLGNALITSSLLIASHLICRRMGSDLFRCITGFYKAMPYLTFMMIVSLTATLCIPGFLTYISYSIVLWSIIWENHLSLFVLMLAIPLLSANMTINIAVRMFSEKIYDEENGLQDISAVELAGMLLPNTLLIAAGLYPAWLMEVVSAAIKYIYY